MMMRAWFFVLSLNPHIRGDKWMSTQNENAWVLMLSRYYEWNAITQSTLSQPFIFTVILSGPSACYNYQLRPDTMWQQSLVRMTSDMRMTLQCPCVMGRYNRGFNQLEYNKYLKKKTSKVSKYIFKKSVLRNSSKFSLLTELCHVSRLFQFWAALHQINSCCSTWWCRDNVEQQQLSWQAEVVKMFYAQIVVLTSHWTIHCLHFSTFILTTQTSMLCVNIWKWIKFSLMTILSTINVIPDCHLFVPLYENIFNEVEINFICHRQFSWGLMSCSWWWPKLFEGGHWSNYPGHPVEWRSGRQEQRQVSRVRTRKYLNWKNYYHEDNQQQTRTDNEYQGPPTTNCRISSVPHTDQKSSQRSFLSIQL